MLDCRLIEAETCGGVLVGKIGKKVWIDALNVGIAVFCDDDIVGLMASSRLRLFNRTTAKTATAQIPTIPRITSGIEKQLRFDPGSKGFLISPF